MLDIKPDVSIVAMYALENSAQMLVCTSSGLFAFLALGTLHDMSVATNSSHKQQHHQQQHPRRHRRHQQQPQQQQQQPKAPKDLEYTVYDLEIKVYSTAIIPTRYDKSYDVWMGSDNGEMLCFSLKSMQITGQYSHNSDHHYLTSALISSASASSSNSMRNAAAAAASATSNARRASTFQASDNSAESKVTLIKTSQNDTFFLWSYVYPGILLYSYISVSFIRSFLLIIF